MIDTMVYRELILQTARVKYIDTGITSNITEALRLYLENDAEPNEQVPLFITTPELQQVRELLKIIRPRCDDCDSELFLKTGARDPEGEKYPTAWICKNCGIEYYSNKSPAEWLKELKDEARKQSLHEPNKPV